MVSIQLLLNGMSVLVNCKCMAVVASMNVNRFGCFGYFAISDWIRRVSEKIGSTTLQLDDARPEHQVFKYNSITFTNYGRNRNRNFRLEILGANRAEALIRVPAGCAAAPSSPFSAPILRRSGQQYFRLTEAEFETFSRHLENKPGVSHRDNINKHVFYIFEGK